MLKEVYFGLRTGSSGITKNSFEEAYSRVYRKVGQDEKALALVTQLLQEDDSPDFYYKRAEIYKKWERRRKQKWILPAPERANIALWAATKNFLNEAGEFLNETAPTDNLPIDTKAE